VRLIDEFKRAWRTFGGVKQVVGWQVIPVTSFKNVGLMAGLAALGLREAAFFNFSGATLPRPELLPSGKGFSLEYIEMEGRHWIVLTRSQEGIADLYISMLENLFKLLDELHGNSGNTLIQIFLDRVSAWQDFMSAGQKHLGIESQTGLYGELLFLKSLLDIGLKDEAVKNWDGPLRGLQDFHIGFGAVEVKSTVSQDGFIAKIGSLEQLSDSTFSPIFLVGQKLSINSGGISLPILIESIREELKDEPALKNNFDTRLMRSGYLDTHSSIYDRELHLMDSLMFEVDSSFPKLTPESVSPHIRSARYEVDISTIASKKLDLKEILNRLGVKK
jgi:hypothetical protein